MLPLYAARIEDLGRADFAASARYEFTPDCIEATFYDAYPGGIFS
jgi:hypothetical protein